VDEGRGKTEGLVGGRQRKLGKGNWVSYLGWCRGGGLQKLLEGRLVDSSMGSLNSLSGLTRSVFWEEGLAMVKQPLQGLWVLLEAEMMWTASSFHAHSLSLTCGQGAELGAKATDRDDGEP
jgi:hypothetical protein